MHRRLIISTINSVKIFQLLKTKRVNLSVQYSRGVFILYHVTHVDEHTAENSLITVASP